MRFHNTETNKVDTETVEAGSFKTSTRVNGPVTFFSSSGRSGDKVAHYNNVLSVRHETLDVDNDPDGDGDDNPKNPFGSSDD